MGARRITEAAQRASTYTPEGNAMVMDMVAQLHDGIDLGDEREVIKALFLCNRTGAEITTYLDRVIEEARAQRAARQSLVGFSVSCVRDLTAAFLVVCAVFAACLGHAHAGELHPLREATWGETVTVLASWWLLFSIFAGAAWAGFNMAFPKRRVPDDYDQEGA